MKVKVKSDVAQSCPTLFDPMDCSLPGSSLHEILQARILEWVAISFSRGSSRLRDQTQVSCIAGRRFNLWATGEVLENHSVNKCDVCSHNFDTHKLHEKQQRKKESVKTQRNISLFLFPWKWKKGRRPSFLYSFIKMNNLNEIFGLSRWSSSK